MNELLHDVRARCLGKNQSLPSLCYTSKEFLQLERDKVLSAAWICLGRSDEVANPGDYFCASLLDEPVIVTRATDATIYVLSNVCRHRGMQLASGSGNADRLRCPYHAWSYQLDGQLRHAPMMKGAVKKSDCRLPELNSFVWQGFVFANLDAQARKPDLQSLEQLLTNYHVDEMRHQVVFEELWHCNWKCLVENFMDGYHLSVVHPKTLKPLTPTNLSKKSGSSPGWTGYNAGYAKSAPARIGGHPDLSEEERRQSRLFCVYPALVVSVSADVTAYLSMQPQGVDRVAVKWGIAGGYGDPDQQTIDSNVKKWSAINAEDHDILEKLQRGLQSKMFVGGALAPQDLEGTVSDFHDYLIERLIA